MALKLKQEPLKQGSLTEELRSDDETLRRVMALALELQGSRDGTYSLAEMERIGAEIGVEPEFVRQAHAQVAATSATPKQKWQYWHQHRSAVVAAWWAAGWVVPVIIASVPGGRLTGGSLLLFFLSWAVYIGGGILLSASMNSSDPATNADSTPSGGIVPEGGAR
jgi:hypothetical protein